jgi:hypothetical protein
MLLLVFSHLQTQNDVKPFDFTYFKSTRVHPGSDPRLQSALNRLYLDCPSFQTVIGHLSKEQPNISLLLATTEEKTFGTLKLDKSPNGYLITVFTQVKLANLESDAIEPWLGSILFALLDVTRKGDVLKLDSNTYLFDKKTETAMWYFQQKLRKELMKSKISPRLKLAQDALKLYNARVLGLNNHESFW